MPSPPQICLSIDTEFWDSPEYFGVAADKHRGFGNAGCQALLRLFAELGIHTTFFVVAEFAERHPRTIYQILEEGHEVASHSCTHRRLSRLPLEQQTWEINQSKVMLEQRFGIAVRGFRSPGNQIIQGHFGMLDRAGYAYDSSWHPALLPGRIGELLKSRPGMQQDGIIEIPISTLGALPVSWVWLRNSGPWLARWAARYNHLLRRAAVFYLHCWEFEPLPSVRGVPGYVTRRTGGEFLNMLAGLIRSFQRQGKVVGRMDRILDGLCGCEWEDEFIPDIEIHSEGQKR
ncbi:MAG: polysaccharide deacetylase family protein [Methanothrix sp.]|nr:polysaccharide deacetylase family protein [Methanothrix sp.]